MTVAEFVLRVVKAFVEVAALCYLGQGIVAIFAGGLREQNLFYKILRTVTSPVTRATRLLMPRFMPDRHIPFIAFGLLFWIWVAIILAIVYLRRGAAA